MNTTIIVVAGIVLCALVGLAMWSAWKEDKIVEQIKRRLRELEDKKQAK